MTAKTRVLVVEDHYSIATELGGILMRHGYDVVGPVGTVAAALEALTERPDVALLDINLHGQPVFPVAERLTRLGIPFAFTSGYEANVLPSPFSSTPRLEKPVDAIAVRDMVHGLLSQAGVGR